jgi:hypothetical protein
MRSVSIHRQLGSGLLPGTGDLSGQQFDDAVVFSVVVQFHDSVSVAVAEPKQSGSLRANHDGHHHERIWAA